MFIEWSPWRRLGLRAVQAEVQQDDPSAPSGATKELHEKAKNVGVRSIRVAGVLDAFLLEMWPIRASSAIRPATKYWQLVSTVSGATSGFTYVVASSDLPTFLPGLETIEILGWDRGTVCGVFLGTAFLCSLVGSLLSAMLYGEVNFAGENHMAQFTVDFWFLFDVPFLFTAIGILFMLFNAVTVIGGMYSSLGLYIYLAVAGSVVILFLIAQYVVFRRRTRRIMRKELAEVSPSLEKLGKTKVSDLELMYKSMNGLVGSKKESDVNVRKSAALI